MFSIISIILYVIGLVFGIRGFIQYCKDRKDIRAPWNLFTSLVLFNISSMIS